MVDVAGQRLHHYELKGRGKAKRRYTADPKAKKGEPTVEPRGRKGKRG